MIPWKLILVLIIAVVLALFIGFNLNNKCEISFVFGKVVDVPVYLTILISFVAGLAVAFPFSIRRRVKKDKDKQAQTQTLPAAGTLPATGNDSSANGAGDAETGAEAPSDAGNGSLGRKNDDRKKKKHADGKPAE